MLTNCFSIVNIATKDVLTPEVAEFNGKYKLIKKILANTLYTNMIPTYIIRKTIGGCDHISLVKSKKMTYNE